MIIRALGQSGYILKTEHSELIIDPYLSDSVNRVAGRPRLLPIPIKYFLTGKKKVIQVKMMLKPEKARQKPRRNRKTRRKHMILIH